jgi:hypothetical protein
MQKSILKKAQACCLPEDVAVAWAPNITQAPFPAAVQATTGARTTTAARRLTTVNALEGRLQAG